MENNDSFSAHGSLSEFGRDSALKDNGDYCRTLAERYRSDVEILVRYLPWLETKVGQSTSQEYDGQDLSSNSMTFPVYDGTLMSFVKDVQRTTLLSRNYFYIYSRNRLRTADDEKRLIASSEIIDMDNLTGILSKYIYEGMTKGRVWSEGVRNGVFLGVIRKMKENIDYWDGTADK